MKKYLLLILLILTPLNTAKAAGIPVVDGAHIIETVVNGLAIYEKLWLYKEEFKIIENQIRGLAELIGEDGLELVLEKLEEEWGTEQMIDAISSLDPESESFLDDVNNLLEGTLGGIALDDEQIEELIANTGIEDEEYIYDLKQEFVEYRNRDALYKQSIYAAAQADARRLEMQEQISTAKEQLAGLGSESEVASIQFIGETNLLLANQNQEILGIMARILAKQQERDMVDNMEVMNAERARLEEIYNLKNESLNDVDYSDTYGLND